MRESSHRQVRLKSLSTARLMSREPRRGVAMKPRDYQELFVGNLTNCKLTLSLYYTFSLPSLLESTARGAHAPLFFIATRDDAEEVCSAGDCPDFRVSENGTVPFIAEAVEAQGRRGADDDRPSTVNITRCSCQDGSLSAGRFSVGGSPLSYVIAVVILGIGLAAASACEVSRFQAVANNSARAAPAPSVSEPGFEGKTDSKPVRGDGKTSYASITELRVYNMDVKHQLKIAASDREVARTG